MIIGTRKVLSWNLGQIKISISCRRRSCDLFSVYQGFFSVDVRLWCFPKVMQHFTFHAPLSPGSLHKYSQARAGVPNAGLQGPLSWFFIHLFLLNLPQLQPQDHTGTCVYEQLQVELMMILLLILLTAETFNPPWGEETGRRVDWGLFLFDFCWNLLLNEVVGSRGGDPHWFVSLKHTSQLKLQTLLLCFSF